MTGTILFVIDVPIDLSIAIFSNISETTTSCKAEPTDLNNKIS
jgi:hypothetical protein